MVAWKKVARYWKDSGLSDECTTTATACRSFVIDTPWSAAFVSCVMRRAALPGFGASASHVDYVRAAYRDPEGSAYRIADPRWIDLARSALDLAGRPARTKASA